MVIIYFRFVLSTRMRWLRGRGLGLVRKEVCDQDLETVYISMRSDYLLRRASKIHECDLLLSYQDVSFMSTLAIIG